MSEGSNHNLEKEFKSNIDKAHWFVTRVLPVMKVHFDNFNEDVIVNALTGDKMDVKRVKHLYSSSQKKSKKFEAKNVKKTRTAYWFFANDKRASVQEEHADEEGFNFAQLNTILGQMWAELSDKQKTVYEKKHLKDKARYQKEYDAAKQEAIASGQWQENPLDSVKKPRSAYIFFSKEPSVREKYMEKAGGDHRELMKILGHAWSNLSDKAKEPYNKMAKKDKARHDKEKAEALKQASKLAPPAPVSDDEVEAEVESEAEAEVEAPAPKKKTTIKGKKKKTTTKVKKAKKQVSSDEEDAEDVESD